METLTLSSNPRQKHHYTKPGGASETRFNYREKDSLGGKKGGKREDCARSPY